MSTPLFRLVCGPRSLDSAEPEWVEGLRMEGEIALALGGGGFEPINELAHKFGMTSVTVIRDEPSDEARDETVRTYAAELALIWIAESFSEDVRRWAKQRAPMTLLVEATGPLPASELQRVDRFIAILSRQTD